MDMDASQYLGSLPQIIQDLSASNRSQVAATTWLWYDWFICLEDEIELIWKQKMSLPKCLYIISRYYGMFSSLYFAIGVTQPTMPDKLCAMWGQFFGGSTIVAAACCDTILVLRLYALYGRQLRVLIALGTVVVGELVVEAVIVALVNYNESAVPKPPFLPITGCLTTSMFGSLTLVAWVPALAANTIYFILILYKLYPHIRPLALMEGKFSLLTVFVRDGSIFYTILFASLLVNALIPPLVARSTRVGLQSVGVPWAIAALSFCGSRLTLNLRSAVASDSLPPEEHGRLGPSRDAPPDHRRAALPFPSRPLGTYSHQETSNDCNTFSCSSGSSTLHDWEGRESGTRSTSSNVLGL